MAAHKKFTDGPAAHINISEEKLPISADGISDAPNGVRRISRNLTFEIRAANMCPSS